MIGNIVVFQIYQERYACIVRCVAKNLVKETQIPWLAATTIPDGTIHNVWMTHWENFVDVQSVSNIHVYSFNYM